MGGADLHSVQNVMTRTFTFLGQEVQLRILSVVEGQLERKGWGWRRERWEVMMGETRAIRRSLKHVPDRLAA